METINKLKKHILSVLSKADKKIVIIAVSGGIDSAVALYLLNETIPLENIYVIHLNYFKESISRFQTTIKPLNLPEENILLYPINGAVDTFAKELQVKIQTKKVMQNNAIEKVRMGNIMARVRMTFLFDQARKLNALVCGTENRSENYLGYFTRFGDAASDFEVINHLYKTEVRALARELHVPQDIIDAPPSAGLWDNQTDEKELGCTYDEIDEVLRLHFDERLTIEEIEKQGYKNVRKILQRVEKNRFKHEVPYLMKKDLSE